MTPLINQETWLKTLQDFLRYYLEAPSPTPLVSAGSLTLLLVGVFLVFRCWKFERLVVAVVGLVLGAWLGYWISLLVGAPPPISAAVVAIASTFLAYRTYRWWLAGGSVVVLFCLALVFQLGQGDLRRYLPDLSEGLPEIKGDLLQGLPTALEQDRRLHPDWADRFAKMKEPAVRELKALGPVGWLFPVGAAILGGLLAYWALRAFSVIWLGFLGASVATLGASTFLCAHWPEVRTWMISKPQFPAGLVIGLWLMGLIVQAKEARFPKKKPGAGAPASDSPKS